MNAFVRKLAVLSVLWSLCELILPEGRQQQLVRMTASVLVMTALVSSAGEWIGTGTQWPAWSEQVVRASETGYQKTVLTALANQVEAYCVHLAQRAGYDAGAAVWLRMDGTVERIELTLTPAQTQLMTPQEMQARLAQQLQIEQECIHLEGA